MCKTVFRSSSHAFIFRLLLVSATSSRSKFADQNGSTPLIPRLLLGCFTQELLQGRLHARDIPFQSLRVGPRFLNHFAGLVDVCGGKICAQERLDIAQVVPKGLQLTSDVAQTDVEFIIPFPDFRPPLSPCFATSTAF